MIILPAETYLAFSPLPVVLAVAVVVLLAVGIWFRYLRVAPDAARDEGGVRIALYHLPGTRLRKLRAGALILPVGGNGWIGRSVGKLVRDAGGDVIQEELSRGGRLPEAGVRAAGPGRLGVKAVIAANIFDENAQTTPERVARAYDAALEEAARRGARSVILADFSDIFAYARDRTDEGFARRALLDAVRRNRDKLDLAILYVPDGRTFPAYRKALATGFAGRQPIPAEG